MITKLYQVNNIRQDKVLHPPGEQPGFETCAISAAAEKVFTPVASQVSHQRIGLADPGEVIIVVAFEVDLEQEP